MRIYVAAAFSDRVNAKEWITKLQGVGHVITHDWTGESAEGKKGDELAKYLKKCAQDDVNGVITCDAFIMLAHDNGRGSHTEFGMAIALSKSIFVVGPESTKNIFFHLNEVVLCKDFDDVAWWLTEMERKASEAREHKRRSGLGSR